VAVALLLIGVVLVRNNVARVRSASSASSESALVPLTAITGQLASRFQGATPTQKIVLTGNPSDDAEAVLAQAAAFWRNVKSFRVRMRFKEGPSPRPSEPRVDITAVLVGERPNRLMLRYENWYGGKAMVSDGKTVRVSSPDPDVSNDARSKFYLEGHAPETIGTFLSDSQAIGLRLDESPSIVYTDDVLMPLLPFLESADDFVSRRGYRVSRLKGIETLDGVRAYHLEFLHSPVEQEREDNRLQIWIAADGRPLVLKCKDPLYSHESATYIDWVLDPVLPEGVFKLPPTHGYSCTTITLNPQKALIGKLVPNLRLRMLDGKTRELTSFRGQIVLLDFWATWCGPCLAELPVLKQVARDFSPHGVTMLAVTDEEDTDQIRKTLASRKLDPPIAIDVEHNAGEFFGVSTLPHLVLIDRDGIVRDVYVGFSPHLESELREQLEKLTR